QRDSVDGGTADFDLERQGGQPTVEEED
ncbi:hypothetical protein A2U01_0106256, partial [Trifolium medium]|nr:hypothetical protein [Trifolium medium]